MHPTAYNMMICREPAQRTQCVRTIGSFMQKKFRLIAEKLPFFESPSSMLSLEQV
jgi:hypothetical protein